MREKGKEWEGTPTFGHVFSVPSKATSSVCSWLLADWLGTTAPLLSRTDN